MAWGAAIGAIGGALISSQSADDQADAMRGATREQIALQEEQFDYARGLQEALMARGEPRGQASQRAMRSLSSIMGLGDPGSSPSITDQIELQNLQNRLEDTDQYKREFVGVGDYSKVEARDPDVPSRMQTEQTMFRNEKTGELLTPDEYATRLGQGEQERIENPEYIELQEEINTLQQEMGTQSTAEGGWSPAQDITELEGYQFQKEQGLDALAASGAAKGMQLSGAQMEGAQKFGQGLASQYRGQLIDELSMMAGMRPTNQPANNLSNIAMQQGQTMGGLQQQMGMIGAAETAGTYNALGSAMSNINWQGLMNNNTNQTYGGGSSYGGTTGSGATLAVPSGGGY